MDKQENQLKDIKLYHIENGGIANARNLALSYAQGEFVAFVDSDDSVSNDYLEVLINAISKYNADISFVPITHM